MAKYGPGSQDLGIQGSRAGDETPRAGDETPRAGDETPWAGDESSLLLREFRSLYKNSDHCIRVRPKLEDEAPIKK